MDSVKSINLVTHFPTDLGTLPETLRFLTYISSLREFPLGFMLVRKRCVSPLYTSCHVFISELGSDRVSPIFPRFLGRIQVNGPGTFVIPYVYVLSKVLGV